MGGCFSLSSNPILISSVGATSGYLIQAPECPSPAHLKHCMAVNVTWSTPVGSRPQRYSPRANVSYTLGARIIICSVNKSRRAFGVDEQGNYPFSIFHLFTRGRGADDRLRAVLCWLERIVKHEGSLDVEHWKFTGKDLGKHTIIVKVHNWGDKRSYASVWKALEAARKGWYDLYGKWF
ncbi:hypothetical protein BKA70DRAFT_1535941 [Coprinopsis sp. MPI-PUGE-AT-0042]|nr:hypothetical protein BKA70DRAFT_1535941 [Coprinopsis sp. MPI-PUGE-AT-0042]